MRVDCCLPVGVERPLHRVFNEAMLKHCTGMIEDQSVGLVRSWAKHATNHLAIQAERLRRTRQHTAGNVGLIPALGQHHAVGDEFDFASRQTAQDFVTLIVGRLAVDVLGTDASLDELVFEVDRMRDARRKDHCLAALS